MLTGKKIILRELKEADSALYQQWINNRTLVQFNSAFKPISDAEHEIWFKNITSQKDLAIFSIVEKSEHNLIGTCSLRNISSVHRCAELQIRIGDDNNKGKGLGTEAVILLLTFGFEDLNLNRVYLSVFSKNERAIKTYLKTGFKKEGTQRQGAFIEGSYVDVDMMSILQADFFNNQKQI